MKITNKIIDTLNGNLLFKIIFTIFAGITTFLACYNMNSGWNTFYMVACLAFYGFACFTLWSGLCGGMKTANIFVLITVIASLSSFYFQGVSMSFIDDGKYWAYNICVVFRFLTAICGIAMSGMFIASIVFKKDIFKMIAVFCGVGLVGSALLAYIFVFLRVVGLGNGVDSSNKPYFLEWTNLLSSLLPILSTALVVAVMSKIDEKIEIK